MPITPYLKGKVFPPEETRAMGIAFEQACKSLGLMDKSDPLTEIIAAKIIELAHRGEHDPERLCARALSAYQPPVGRLHGEERSKESDRK
jgi:hypothetical protein